MWNTKDGINLSNVAVQGGLPTLGTGTYTGRFISSTEDGDGLVWVTVITDDGHSHVEETTLDVSSYKLNDPIKFTVGLRDGAYALLNGSRYKLKQAGNDLTKWVSLADLHKYIKENNITLAEPKLEKIDAIQVCQAKESHAPQA